MENCYSALGVLPSADRHGIRRQYRALARALHPDRCSSDLQRRQATEAMARIGRAYSVLDDPQRRAAHDEALLRHRPGGREQQAQTLLHVTRSLAEVMRTAPDLPGLDQSQVNRILQGAADRIPEALKLVEGRISVLDGSSEVAAFMALAKSFTSFVADLPAGREPEPAYAFLIKATAFGCVRGLPWAQRLSWPDPVI